ncbi:hypothetical protein HII31_12599 [Pseudocercospora fuligena]|uniref:F-box domain-containing protein n=1 Tax=Pseudocercospora fuligena TaxID=685502 RepID=A0A8H6VD00_9PEZI|nr:hypothetical protein HII31_12599 [Pseudocercospora fuligena]
MATSLDALPAEIHLAVLSWLSAKDIQKCRRINHYFQQLIDLSENQQLCVGPSIARSLDRLKQLTDKYCDYPLDTTAEDGTPTAFLDALVAFLRLRGIVIPSSDHRHRNGVSLFNDRLIRFSKHWVYRSTGAVVRQWDGSSEAHTSSGRVAEMAHKLLEYHMLHDHEERNIGEGLRNFLIAASQEGLQILGLREPKDMLRWLDMIVGEPGVFSHVPIMHGEQYSRTGAMSWGIVPKAARLNDQELAHEMNKRAKALNMPQMDETSPFKYMVHTTWARDHVQAAVSAKVDNIVRAAVLEEMFLLEKPKAQPDLF